MPQHGMHALACTCVHTHIDLKYMFPKLDVISQCASHSAVFCLSQSSWTSRPLLFKVWPPNQQHQQQLGVKNTVSWALSQVWTVTICILTSFPSIGLVFFGVLFVYFYLFLYFCCSSWVMNVFITHLCFIPSVWQTHVETWRQHS